MKVLALDISTNAGWALLEKEEHGMALLGPHGLIKKEKRATEYGKYPRSYRLAAKAIADRLIFLVQTHRPDVVVIEETNQGKNRYTQKLLEWIHLYVQLAWDSNDVGWVIEGPSDDPPGFNRNMAWVQPDLVYISTGTWKQVLGLKKPKDAKKNDQLLKLAKSAALARFDEGTQGYRRILNEGKRRLGIKGKWNKKMLAVNYVNAAYDLNWKLKDNDVAEAICLGLAFIDGASHCDGNPSGKEIE